MPNKITYLFFEPKNDDFFSPIVESYSDWYIGSIRDAADALENEFRNSTSQEEIDKTLKNYRKNLPFRGCNFFTETGCIKENRKCGEGDKCVVLTSRQSDLLSEAVNTIIEALEKSHDHNNVIINMIKQRCPWSVTLEQPPFSVDPEDKKFLERYAKRIDSKPSYIKYNADKIVFARANANSNYRFISSKLKNIKGMSLEACDEYQKIIRPEDVPVS